MGNKCSCSFQKNMRNIKEKKRQRTSELLADRLKKWVNQYITYYICGTKTSIDNLWRSFTAPRKNSLPARTNGPLSPPARSPHIFIYSLICPPRAKVENFPPRPPIAPRVNPLDRTSLIGIRKQNPKSIGSWLNDLSSIRVSHRGKHRGLRTLFILQMMKSEL
jgi:hypothetical protein